MASNGRLRKAVSLAIMPAAMAAVGASLASGANAQTPAQSATKLTILSPRANEAVGAGSFALDVRFESRGTAPVVSAELWVDGVRWAQRDLDAPQVKNVLSFSVDASTLSEGQHTVLVKVINSAGQASQTQLPIIAGTNEGVVEGSISGPEMAFRAPGNGKRVSGTLELLLDAKSRAGVNPYVTFYIDKQFKTLKNYPPYSYLWDSTTVPNGYHTIEAMGYLESNNAATTRRIQVYVDNAGGNTTLKTDIADLRPTAPKPAVAVKPTPAPQPAATAATATVEPLAIPLPKPLAAPVSSPITRPMAPALRSLGLNTNTPASLLAPSARSATPRGLLADAVAPKAPRVPRAAAVRSKTTSVKAVLESLTPAPLAATVVTSPVAPAPKAIRTPAGTPLARPLSVAAKPTAMRAALVPRAPIAPARVTAAAPRPVVELPGAKNAVRLFAKANPRAMVRPTHKPLIDITRLSNNLPNGAMQVAFNGTRIAFDVQPRVEAGLPIAPFRQIFEHTGGQVMWVAGTHVVRAVNADREVIISVGKATARVNGQNVSLARPAFVERGRTIVPLAFVGQALDVDVKYDPATGHVQITNKK